MCFNSGVIWVDVREKTKDIWHKNSIESNDMRVFEALFLIQRLFALPLLHTSDMVNVESEMKCK